MTDQQPPSSAPQPPFPGPAGHPVPGPPPPAAPAPGWPGAPAVPMAPGAVGKAPKSGKAGVAVVGAVAVLLVAGCCVGGRFLFKADEPMSSAEYATELAATDNTLKAQAAALTGKDPKPMIDALRAEAAEFKELTPPENAEKAHRLAYGSMLALADDLEKPAENSCKVVVPAAGRLTSGGAGAIRLSAKELAAVAPEYRFGTFLPAEPKESKRQLKNGALIGKSAGRGPGALQVQNSFGGDTTVSLVPDGSNTPAYTFYLRSGGNATITGIKYDTYRMFTAGGEDWDAKGKGFTRDCSFAKFDDTFVFSSRSPSWEVRLTQSAGGNASTSQVDPGAFPGN